MKGRFNVSDVKNTLTLTLEIHNSSNTTIDTIDFALATQGQKEFITFDSLKFIDSNQTHVDKEAIKQKTKESNNSTLILYFNPKRILTDSIFIKFKIIGYSDSTKYIHAGQQTFIAGQYNQRLSR
jgi:hypothetical protein